MRSRTGTGAAIARIGPMLLAERYDDAHVFVGLLQHAEDGLARREDWQGSRAVPHNRPSAGGAPSREDGHDALALVA